MGKTGGATSWLTAVKRAFRSPTKDNNNSKDSDKTNNTNTSRTRRKLDHHHQQQQQFEQEKKSERRRWLFRKQQPQPHSGINNEAVAKDAAAMSECIAPKTPVLPAEQRHAIAVAAATAAAAEAAVATAKAAVEIIRLTQPPPSSSTAFFKQNLAAKAIQSAFRGYLARKALIALKGIVKLQALIRGQNVRKQANMTLKCMQALLRVQARVRDQRARLSHDGRRSMFAETTNLWESKYLKDVRDRNSRSREGSCVTDDWRDCPRTLEELEAILKARNESALAHEKSLSFAFSQQNKILESDREDSDVADNRGSYLDRWMATKQWESSSRASTDYHRRDSIKTVEVDSLKAPSHSTPSNGRRSRCQSPIHHRHAARPRSPQVRPASPRCLADEKSYSTANTPSLRSSAAGQRLTGSRYSTSTASNDRSGPIPNYMASTESAKARIRSQSAPRQRPSTPERERSGGSAKKRLSYPIPDPYCVNFGFGCNPSNMNPNQGQGQGQGQNLNMRSPSFKSVQAGYVGMEEQSNYTESIVGGEISPCSTTDLRRWLR
ncbi:protein IQ-DOMAIN 17-like [Andrographis paniculata]|uniref:protein IQ-DOMAIN 17-like n=1 Tax=Andrographis paniculata TaxID=175694 RepID=UPI0021E7A36A|nr:protein IQ-DOMAIN 17-like [Andrographis paniculata]